MGYYYNAPSDVGIYDPQVWNNYNNVLDSLRKLTGKDYEKFKIAPKRITSKREVVSPDKFKITLGGLISKLHLEHFFDDFPSPVDNIAPSMVISQNQNQNIQVQILLDFQSFIDNKIGEYEKSSKEQEFLQKIKSSLAKVKGFNDLVLLIVKVGKEVGLTVEQLYKIFS